jgi:hypothetical protein
VDADAAAVMLLGRSWFEIEAAAEDLLERGDAAVTRWQWSGPRAHLWEEREPVVGFEDPFKTAPGDPGSARRRDFAHFGYDDDDRIVVAHRFADRETVDGVDGGALEIACVWIDGVFVRFVHDPWAPEPGTMSLHTVGRNLLDGRGRVSVIERWTRDEFRRSTFSWDDEHPVGVVHERSYRDEVVERDRVEHERDAEGLLRVRWTTEFSRSSPESVGHSWVGWHRRSPKALRAARRLVDEGLPARILDWAARIAPDEPVYALGLVWSVDAPELPPWLALSTVSELREWRERHPARRELQSRIWDPAAWRCADLQPAELEADSSLQDAYALLRDDWELAGNEAEPAATLRRCAKRLMAADWPQDVRRADAFAVVVMSDEPNDITAAVRKTVPVALQRAIEDGL